MFFYLAIKNIIARKSSAVIVAFIAFAIMLLVATNAVFDSTEHGVEETFTHSFCGDIVIRPFFETQLSLFGDDTPVTGELSSIPNVIPFDEIEKELLQIDEIERTLPQVSGTAMMEAGSKRVPVTLFGVDGEKYAEMMNALSISEGRPFSEGEKGLMLTKKHADELGVKIGDTVQFTVADGISFRIRAVPLTAVYEYAVENATLDKIVLIDAPTLRALLDMSDTVQNETIEEADFMLDDFDSLFDSASDTQAVVTETISDDVFENEVQEAKSASWNFIICRLKDAKDTKKVMHKINRIFKEKDYPAEAVNWRKSAGNTAIYLYWMRLILNVGIIIVLFSGFIVINNTLVINVLDRIREIGTMRAIGANKRFVSAMCMTETFIIACAAGVLGIIAGAAVSAMINAAHISFSNLFLMQLFGGARLVTKITAQNILHSAAVALILGLLSWIYPVSAALKAIPVQAMQGAK